jgi:hypothetical protein
MNKNKYLYLRNSIYIEMNQIGINGRGHLTIAEALKNHGST